jgi:hypothetical protein
LRTGGLSGMRTMFAVYLFIIVAGLALAFVFGALAQ